MRARRWWARAALRRHPVHRIRQATGWDVVRHPGRRRGLGETAGEMSLDRRRHPTAVPAFLPRMRSSPLGRTASDQAAGARGPLDRSTPAGTVTRRGGGGVGEVSRSCRCAAVRTERWRCPPTESARPRPTERHPRARRTLAADLMTGPRCRGCAAPPLSSSMCLSRSGSITMINVRYEPFG